MECGFVPDKDKDPKDRHFYQAIHQIARYEQVEELIPCNRGPGVLEVGNFVNFYFMLLGEIYPPLDCWELKGGRKRKSGTSSTKLGGKVKKADKVRRFKVSQYKNLNNFRKRIVFRVNS